MNTLSSFYKIFTDIDLARNDLFNVSRIIGNQYSSLGKDLEITTWDSKGNTDVKAGDLVLHAGVATTNPGDSGRIFIFAGSESSTDNGIFNEDAVLTKYTTTDSKDLYKGIQVNPDSSVSIYSDNSTTGTINAVGNAYVRFISGNSLIKLTSSSNKIEILNKNNSTAGHVDLQTNDLNIIADDVDVQYLTLTKLVGADSVANANYYLTVESENGVLTSREGLDYITLRKQLLMTADSVFRFLGGEIDVDATIVTAIDSPTISIGTVASGSSTNANLYIYSAANGFKIDATAGNSKLQVYDVDINDALKVYGTITLGQTDTSSTLVDSLVEVKKKLTITSPEFDIKNTGANESILIGTGPANTYLKVNKADVHTKLTSEVEFVANKKATLDGTVTINNSSVSGVDNKTSIYSAQVIIDNHTSAAPTTEPSVGLIKVSTDYISTGSDFLNTNISTIVHTGSSLTATLSTKYDITASQLYSVKAGTPSVEQNKYSYEVNVALESGIYKSSLLIDNVRVRDTINTARLVATDFINTDSLIVGNMVVYWDSTNNSMVFAKR